jgi:hypothetical protein
MAKRECKNGCHRNGRPAVSTASDGAGPGATAGGRGADGKFAKGTHIAVGNAHARHMAALRAELLEAVGTGGIRRIAAALIRNLEKGDLDSGKVLLRYCVGPPLKGCDPDDCDVDEAERAQAAVPLASLLRVDSVSPAVALTLAKVVQKLALQMAVASPAGQLVGTAGWDRIFEELNDTELSEWWRELTELQREAQQAAAREAARKPAHADGGGGTARK